MDEMMNGGGMQGGEGMVSCPCCGQGQVPVETAEKVMEALEPEQEQDDMAGKLAQAMATKGPMMRKG